MKKLLCGLFAFLLVISASVALAAASPSKIIATHEKMLEIERKLIKYIPPPEGIGYSVNHRYSGYSVDDNGTPTYYYPNNISLSTVKKTLKDLGLSSSGIKFVPVEYSWYNLRGAIVPMEKAIAQRVASLGFSPSIEFVPEENKIVAYGVPEDEASRKALLYLSCRLHLPAVFYP
jgi:hypothetical protein